MRNNIEEIEIDVSDLRKAAAALGFGISFVDMPNTDKESVYGTLPKLRLTSWDGKVVADVGIGWWS